MAGPRRAMVEVTYMKSGGGKNGSASIITEYTEGVTYTDPATGESDTVSITLSNIGLPWANKWFPEKGDKFIVKIIQKDWEAAGENREFSCGKFCLDDLSFHGPTLTCNIGGVSVPEGNAFRSTERDKTWKDVTLKEIGAEIAGRYHLTYDYTGPTIKLGTVEQKGESDSSFISKTCQNYGMAIKVYYGKLIIYDKGVFESRESVATIHADDMQSWAYNSTLTGTYTGASIKYTSGEDDKEYTCVVGSGKRMLTINEKVESLQEAQIKACASVNGENEKAETMQVEIMADTRITAGCTVEITGLYRINGKYFVDKVTHKIEAEGAYTMDLELHKCQKPISDVSVMQVTERR